MAETTTTTTQHGLAGSIRSSTESEVFDLGGLSASTIGTVIQHAFDEPFPPLEEHEMIRITLVVGAGKQGRQKYDLHALKVVASTLQSLGYQEDRGASCVVQCAGSYKLQHDTGKNLKTVVVFPKVLVLATEEDPNATSASASAAASSSSSVSLLRPDSMEYKIAVASMPVFQNMVQSKCQSWSQKKALLHLMESEIETIVKECDDLLIRGQPLTPAQQTVYEECTALTEKQAHTKHAMQMDVEAGHITQSEWEQLMQQVEARIVATTLKSKPSAHQKALERQQTLRAMTPMASPPKLKHHAQLGKLWKQVQPLMHLNEGGQLLSIQDTKLLGHKLDYLEQIDRLEQASRGWLEADAVFEARLRACRRDFQSKFQSSGKQTAKSKSGKSSVVSASTKVKVPLVTKWITPQEKKTAAIMAKKKAKGKKGDVFGAMMAAYDDSDSEDDEDIHHTVDTDDDDDDEHANTCTPKSKPPQQSQATPSSSSSPNKTTTASKKKKKRKKNAKKGNDEDDAVFAELDAQKKKEEEEHEPVETNALTTTLSIVQNYILPILVAFLGWLIGLLFGTSKKRKQE